MADRLSGAAQQGHNGPTRAEFLEFVDDINEIDGELLDAKETVRSLNKRRKDTRKTIEASGVNIAAFDRHRIDVNRSGEEREAEHQQYLRYMVWREKPVGFQPGMDFQSDDPGLAALNVHELKRIDAEGFAAGKAGLRRDTANSYSPGTEAAQRFDTAWLRGQGEAVHAMGSGAADGEKRGRGRPKGSTNKPRVVSSGDAAPGDVAAPDMAAHELGREDAIAGHMDHAARYPAGTPGHADYFLGAAEGERERHGNPVGGRHTEAVH